MKPLPLLLVSALAALDASAALKVAATTTFVGDLVGQIAGPAIEVQVLYPREADPHAFEPSARDLVALQRSRVLFVNGLGLENALGGQLAALRKDGLVTVEVSDGIKARHGACTHGEAGGHDHEHELDPHVWFDPVAMMTWTTNIQHTLARLDPANAAQYAQQAEAARARLAELDKWIRTQIEVLPPERRVLVTDHDALGYFAERYGLRIVGTVMPAPTTLAEPSARELKALADTIRREKVGVVFAGGSTPPALARRIAEETGAKLVSLPACALGPQQSATGTIDGYLRQLTTLLVDALKAAP